MPAKEFNMYGHRWKFWLTRGTLKEARKEAHHMRQGGYHTTIRRVKNTLGFRFEKRRNGRVVRVKDPWEYAIYQYWNDTRAPKECLPQNLLGRRRG